MYVWPSSSIIAKTRPLVEELSEIVKKAAGLEQTRNTYTHSTWMAPFERGYGGHRSKSTTDRKKGYTTAEEHVRVEDVNKVADELMEVAREAMAFRFRHTFRQPSATKGTLPPVV